MLIYKVMYRFLGQGVHAEVLDFPGTIAFGESLEEVRRSLADALVDMTETNLVQSKPLLRPDPACTKPEANQEPIHLRLTARFRVS